MENKTSSIIRIVTSFIFFLFVSGIGENNKGTSSQVKPFDDKLSIYKSQTIQSSNGNLYRINQMNKQNQQPSQVQNVVDTNIGTLENVIPPNNYSRKTIKGLSQIRNSNQKQITNDVNKNNFPANRQTTPSLKTVADDNTQKIEFDDSIKKDFQTQILTERIKKKNIITNPKTDGNNIFKVENQSFSQSRNNMLKTQQVSDGRFPVLTNDPKGKTNQNFFITNNNGATEVGEFEKNFNTASDFKSSALTNSSSNRKKPLIKIDNFTSSQQNSQFKNQDLGAPSNIEEDKGVSSLIRNQQTKTNRTLQSNLKQRTNQRIYTEPSIVGETERLANGNTIDIESIRQKTKYDILNNLNRGRFFKHEQGIKDDRDMILRADEDKVSKLVSNNFNSVQMDPNFSTGDSLRSIKILYDETFLIHTLMEMNKMEYYDRIKELVKRMDVYIDNFIKTTVMELATITVDKNFDKCYRTSKAQDKYFNVESKYFKKSYAVEGDIIVFLYAIDDDANSAVASSKPCSFYPKSRDTMIASLRVNIPIIFSERKSSETLQTMALGTMIHEMFHILGFSKKNSRRFKLLLDIKSTSYPNLSKLNIKDLVVFDYYGSHWTPSILTNELMTPISGQSKIISIFSMEYLEMVNSRIRTKRDVLSNNSLIDRIYNFNQYLKYKCDDKDQTAFYSHFCSQKQKDEYLNTCDDSFMYVLECSRYKITNNCYERIANTKLTCIDEANAGGARPYESYGDDSRCFFVDRLTKCLSTFLSDEKVYIKGSFGIKRCDRSGQKIAIRYEDQVGSGVFLESQVTCPDLNKFVQAYKKTRCKKGCYGNGICNDGVCHCLKGFDPKSHCRTTLQQHKPTDFVTIPYKVD